MAGTGTSWRSMVRRRSTVRFRKGAPQVIPEEGGPVKRVDVPFFCRFPAGFGACRKQGRGQGGAPGWTNDLEAGPASGDTARRREQVCGCGARPRCSLVGWQASGCGHPFGVPAVAGRGGMGRSACGQRDQSEARPRRLGRGPDLLAITRCPCPGLLTRRPWRRCAWPVTWPARRAWRRRRR